MVLYLLSNAGLVLAGTVGLWFMKRWALILGSALFVTNQLLLLGNRHWHAWTLAPALPVILALGYVRRTN